jgi:bifunctional non-homologous end joining protein LigD
VSSLIPFRISPMLATLVDRPFHQENWVYEEKYDGVRMLAYKEGAKVTLMSRNDVQRNARYPEIAKAVARLKAKTLLLDGEIVVFDAKKVSRFQMLQQGLGKPQYAIFDCLYKDGADLRNVPLTERRVALESSVTPTTLLLLSSRVAENGLKAFQIAKRRGFEGIVAKSLASVYVSRRSKEWLKVKVNQEEEFVIGGFTEPAGARQHFGALLLGAYDRKSLKYVGKVGTGFDEQTLAVLRRKFHKLERAKSPFAGEVREKGAHFLSPKLVAQISFTERTKDGKLRHPVYLGLRDDKSAREVALQGDR